MSARALPVFDVPQFAQGTLTGLKWLALALMTLDHVDAFVYARQLTWAGDLGRLVFPVFAFVIGYNLARPAVDAVARRRILLRLLAFGLLALVPHAVLTGGHALNIMFTFAAAVLLVDLAEARRYAAAAAVFLLAGFAVEYAWPGLAVCLATWALYRWPSPLAAVGVVVATASLYAINGSHYALLALPVVLLASGVRVDLPRSRWAFYVYYPAHLAAFVLLVRAI